MRSDDKPPLTRQSDAWISGLKPWLLVRIEELRDELETPGADAEALRGGIAELRAIIRAVEPPLPEPGTSGAYFPNRAEQQPT